MSTGKPFALTDQNTNYDANFLKRLLKCYFEGTNPDPHDRLLLSAFIKDVVTCIRSPQAGQVPIKFDPLKVANYAITKAEDNPLPLLETDGLLDTGNDVRIQFAHCDDPVFDRARQSRLPMLVACQAEDSAVILYWGYDHFLSSPVTHAFHNICASVPKTNGPKTKRHRTNEGGRGGLCLFCLGQGQLFGCHLGTQLEINVTLCLPCLYKVTQCHRKLPSHTSPFAYDIGVADQVNTSTNPLVSMTGADVTLIPENATVPPLDNGVSSLPCSQVVATVTSIIQAHGDLLWIWANLNDQCKNHLKCIWSTIAVKCMSLYDTMKEAVMFLMFRYFYDFIASLVMPLNEGRTTGSLLFSVFEELYRFLTEQRTEDTVDHLMLPVPMFIQPHTIFQILASFEGQIYPDVCQHVELYACGPYQLKNFLGYYDVSLLGAGVTAPTNTRGLSFGFYLVDETHLPHGQSVPNQVQHALSAGSGHVSDADSSWSDEPVVPLASNDLTENSQHTRMFGNAHENLPQRPNDIAQPDRTDIVNAPVQDIYNSVLRDLFMYVDKCDDAEMTFGNMHVLLRSLGYCLNLTLPIHDAILEDSHTHPQETQSHGAAGEQEEGSELSNCSMVAEDLEHIDEDAVLPSRHRATANRAISLLLKLSDDIHIVQAVTAFLSELQMGTINLHNFIDHLERLLLSDLDSDDVSDDSQASADAYEQHESDPSTDEFLSEEEDKDDKQGR